MPSAMASKKDQKTTIMKDVDNIEEIQVGDLVTVKTTTSGIKEKCLWPENIDKTIRPWDNVLIPKNTIGILIGINIQMPTCMAIVAWGGTLGGQKLVIAGNNIKKATFPAQISPNPLD